MVSVVFPGTRMSSTWCGVQVVVGRLDGGAVWYRKSLIFDFLSWKSDIAAWKMNHLQM